MVTNEREREVNAIGRDMLSMFDGTSQLVLTAYDTYRTDPASLSEVERFADEIRRVALSHFHAKQSLDDVRLYFLIQTSDLKISPVSENISAFIAEVLTHDQHTIALGEVFTKGFQRTPTNITGLYLETELKDGSEYIVRRIVGKNNFTHFSQEKKAG